MSTLDKAGEFKHKGKTYTLYRRDGNPNFHFRYKTGGKATWKSLGTPIKAAAIDRAQAHLTEAQSGNWTVVEAMKLKTAKSFCTIGEILDRLESKKDAMITSDTALKQYGNALSNVLRIATGKSDVRSLPSSVLSEATVDAFVAANRLKGRPDVSTRSALNQARSVFKESRMKHFADLKIPDLKGFRRKPEFKISLDETFVDFDPAAVKAMESAAATLWEERDPVWVVYILMSELGLRNGEAEKARWTDVVERTFFKIDGTPYTQRQLIVQANYDEAARGGQEITDELWTQLLVFKRDDSEHIIPAKDKTERAAICDRKICRFVEQFIAGRRKLAYELRRWAGSRVATRYGIYAAQTFLRHASVTTTEKYYAKNLAKSVSAARSDFRELYGIQATA